jgi:NAD(P)-dependent dehydrogenase (short-subunit alcohol dehydrogenase family)
MIEEMFRAGPIEVGLSPASRRTLEGRVGPLATGSALPFQPGDVVVLSGGARGVTAEVTVALARAFRPTLVLLGRSPAPEPEPDWLQPLTTETEIKRELGARANGDATPRLIGEQYRLVAARREVRRTLDRIEAAGARALYRAVDIRDAATVAALLTALRTELGPIRGLVHGAGVLADALIEDKTGEQFDRVYGTKVLGLRALLAALPPEELRALVLFSSSTARFGRKGQADYAIANEVLNKLAQQQARRLPACRVVAVNWGPWDGGMVTPALKKVFEQEGIGLIPPDAGAEYLVRELQAPADGAVEVMVNRAENEEPRMTDEPSVRHSRFSVLGSSLEDPLPLAFERVLDRAGHPVLDAHVLDGRPVLPAVLILEWLAHAALHRNPGLVFHGCDGLRILQGVILDGPTAPVLRVGAGRATPGDGLFAVPAELRSRRPDGRELLHARAEILLAGGLPPAPPAHPLPDLLPYQPTPEEIYPALLFHGPPLQGIEQVEGCGEQGIVASVRGEPAPGDWIRQPLRQSWITAPLALDCGFQLMVLWTLEQQGAPSLPCSIARYRQYRRAFPADGTRVVVHVTRATALHAFADIDYLDADGRLLARMEGYECAIDPALRRAFQRNQLVSA